MIPEDSRRLELAISDYLLWMISTGYSHKTWQHHERVLNDFLTFVNRKQIAWDDIFTLDTLKAFQEDDKRLHTSTAIRGLCRHLYSQGKIDAPIPRSHHRKKDLPAIYEDYLAYRQESRQASCQQITVLKRVLSAFDDYLKRDKIRLSGLSIEQIDAFWKEFNSGFTPLTCRTYRSLLRGFLSYLHHKRGILPKDLAPLVVGAPIFSRATPPNFLRPHELQQLFDSLTLSSPIELRTYAMVHLAYTLGLRPIEISTITLDDISFTEAELELRNRKGKNPIKLPLPEQTLKAIVAYIVGGRPQSSHRTLFLRVNPPHEPISSTSVSHRIKKSMRELNLPATAYWLRHTYAQNLLEAGASLYEIKEMLGHDTIETTRKYLHIHIELMRKVLFDETL
jgi:site-specific recombinase XerD